LNAAWNRLLLEKKACAANSRISTDKWEVNGTNLIFTATNSLIKNLSNFKHIGTPKIYNNIIINNDSSVLAEVNWGHAEVNMDAEELFEAGRMAEEGGLSLAVHAIGDRANHEVLDAYGQLRRFERDRNLPPLRHRIEHVQVIAVGRGPTVDLHEQRAGQRGV
jgi:hypothetical protein